MAQDLGYEPIIEISSKYDSEFEDSTDSKRLLSARLKITIREEHLHLVEFLIKLFPR